MLRARLLTLLVLGLWASAATGAGAVPGSRGDVAATSRYLTDASSLFRTLIARRPQETARADAVARAVAADCRASVPSYLRTGSTAQGRVWTALVVNVPMITVTLASLRPVRRAYRNAAQALARLRWSAPRITRAVTADARRALAAVALPVPDPCAAVRAASRAGFATVPASVRRLTSQFAHVMRDSEVAPGFGLSTAPLRPSLIAAQGRRVHALRVMETRFERGLYRVIFQPWAHTVADLAGTVDHTSLGLDPSQPR